MIMESTYEDLNKTNLCLYVFTITLTLKYMNVEFNCVKMNVATSFVNIMV